MALESAGLIGIKRFRVDELSFDDFDRTSRSASQEGVLQRRSNREAYGNNCGKDAKEHNFAHFLPGLTLKLCGANEAQRNLRPNERLVSHF